MNENRKQQAGQKPFRPKFDAAAFRVLNVVVFQNCGLSAGTVPTSSGLAEAPGVFTIMVNHVLLKQNCAKTVAGTCQAHLPKNRVNIKFLSI